MNEQEIKNIKISDLHLWTENPRDLVDSYLSDLKIIQRAIENDAKKWNLPKLIQEMGKTYDLSEIPTVVEKNGKYIVFDGNRRVAILKYAQNSTNKEWVSVIEKKLFSSDIPEDEIADKLNAASKDTTDCEHLEETLGNNVTDHIKSAWPNHPIKITFKIMNDAISFHVRDLGTKGKAQTLDMRSDGFKQFISFLLTISAENKNEELKNTILLLDEPETHLHPKAQEYLLNQLINITNNEKDNVVLFATHSNYMIDKKDLGKYYRIEKKKDKEDEKHTHVSQFDKKQTSYAEVSYEVFDILDEQYHNELYDKLRDLFVEDQNSKEPDESKHIESLRINEFNEKYFKQIKKLPNSFKNISKPYKKEAKVTLPTFIRNCVHYPVNKKDDFDQKLAESIAFLRKFWQEKIK